MHDNLTYRHDALRSGWYADEVLLNTANVTPATFGQLAQLAAPPGLPALGKVYAQPLYVTSERANDGRSHNLVIVAGAAGRIYAFDETTASVVWYRDFTNAVAGVRQQRSSDTLCSDLGPDLGIVGTPVIDRNLDMLYVVVATMERGVPATRLHAISLTSGSDRLAPAVLSKSMALIARTALRETGGTIEVALTARCGRQANLIRGSGAHFAAATLRPIGLIGAASAAGDGASQPIISSNGRSPGSAIVWTLQTPGARTGTVTLSAFDARTLSGPLFRGPSGSWTPAMGVASSRSVELISPLVANGRVYAPGDGSVGVFGLLGAPKTSAPATARHP